jgi:uncharacterized repeat protein (TIGR03803 family)
MLERRVLSVTAWFRQLSGEARNCINQLNKIICTIGSANCFCLLKRFVPILHFKCAGALQLGRFESQEVGFVMLGVGSYLIFISSSYGLHCILEAPRAIKWVSNPQTWRSVMKNEHSWSVAQYRAGGKRRCATRLVAATAALVLAVVAAQSARAETFTVLHSFVLPTGANPEKALTRDAQGNLYGTTPQGGTFRKGTVFKLDKNLKYTVIYNFTGGTDGSGPVTYLSLDKAGNLYGTTEYGGDNCCGTVFELMPHSDGSWTESVLHSFTDLDGQNPVAGLIRDPAGNFYGTTLGGGTQKCGCGTVFELMPHSGGGWTEKVLHSFDNTGSDGYYPSANLTRDPSGNLYGTTPFGGSDSYCFGGGCGTVFELSPTSDGSWNETILHAFTGGNDGWSPLGGLIRDASGNLYGTTSMGGSSKYDGVVFKLDTSGNETVLYNFGGTPDGAFPAAGLTRDAEGNFYGTTGAGGLSELGTVFKLTSTGEETVLHSFDGRHGESPNAAVIEDAKGNLYGTTTYGGKGACGDHCGVLFKLSR